MNGLELDGLYVIDSIEVEEGREVKGLQEIKCIGQSTTKWLIQFVDSNSTLWLPFERSINILEKL